LRRLIVGLSGATGAIYGIRMLDVLSKVDDVETHLVLTRAAKMTIQVETPYSVKDVESLADHVHDINNVGASIASGSFRTEGMVIIPCSMKSMGGIALSVGGDLLVRAADVVLKERKTLVLVTRETPLHLGHLESMVSLTRMGAIIFPPVPAFYHRPKTLDDVINQTVTRVLDQFDIDLQLFQRWDDDQMKRYPDGAKVTESSPKASNPTGLQGAGKSIAVVSSRQRRPPVKRRR